MKGKKANRPVNGRCYRKTKLQRFIEEFIQSGDDCWEMEPNEYVGGLHSMYASVYKSVKHFGFCVDVIKKGDRVYIMRKE